MELKPELHKIPYFEFRTINQLVHAHSDELGKALRIVIVFGDLITMGKTFDIELLEVIDDWNGPDSFYASSSDELPMRGKVFFHILSTMQFEEAMQKGTIGSESRISALIERVFEGYEVVYEVPSGFFREELNRRIENEKLKGKGDKIANPLKLSSLVKV